MNKLRDEHEQGLSHFMLQSRRQRFRELLGTETSREKLRLKLAHFRWLDSRHARDVPSDPHQLAVQLRSRGAPPTCFIVSEDERLDGRELPLEEALAAVVSSDHGSLLSCVPGRLALYAAEAPNKTITLMERAA